MDVERIQVSSEDYGYDGSLITKDKNLSTTTDSSWISEKNNGLNYNKDNFDAGYLFKFSISCLYTF